MSSVKVGDTAAPNDGDSELKCRFCSVACEDGGAKKFHEAVICPNRPDSAEHDDSVLSRMSGQYRVLLDTLSGYNQDSTPLPKTRSNPPEGRRLLSSKRPKIAVIVDEIVSETAELVEVEEYPCPFKDCDRTFSTANGRAAHKAHHRRREVKVENQKTDIFPCTFGGCQRSFSTKATMVYHMGYHRKAYECAVKSCTERFRTATARNNHAMKEHPTISNSVTVSNTPKKFEEAKPTAVGSGGRSVGPFPNISNTPKKCEEAKPAAVGSGGRSVGPFHCTYEGCPRVFYSNASRGAHEKQHRRWKLVP